MPDFRPLEWFGKLTQREKLAFFKEILAAFESMDPGAVQRMAMWQRGKTARFTVSLQGANGAMFENVGVHLSVEDADPNVWHLLKDAAAGGMLEFGQGLVATERAPGRLEQSWMAPLGTGSLAVREDGGELMFEATSRNVLPIPSLTSGGIIPFDLPEEDGFIALPFRGSIMFLGIYTDLDPCAVATIMSSPIVVGVAKISRGLMFFGLKIADIYPGWNDMPFSICITPAGLRRISPPDRNGERAFSILLVERRTKTLAAMKPIRMSSRWCAIFDQILEGQEDAIGNYTMTDYESDIRQSEIRWPHPDDMAKDFLAVEQAQTPDR